MVQVFYRLNQESIENNSKTFKLSNSFSADIPVINRLNWKPVEKINSKLFKLKTFRCK